MMNTPNYMVPLDPKVAAAFDRLDPDAKEHFQERAGILEFEAKLTRAEAEVMALVETHRYILRRNG